MNSVPTQCRSLVGHPHWTTHSSPTSLIDPPNTDVHSDILYIDTSYKLSSMSGILYMVTIVKWDVTKENLISLFSTLIANFAQLGPSWLSKCLPGKHLAKLTNSRTFNPSAKWSIPPNGQWRLLVLANNSRPEGNRASLLLENGTVSDLPLHPQCCLCFIRDRIRESLCQLLRDPCRLSEFRVYESDGIYPQKRLQTP